MILTDISITDRQYKYFLPASIIIMGKQSASIPSPKLSQLPPTPTTQHRT